MKRLILFRHGKSDWSKAVESDHERPLTHRGVHASQSMGRLLTALEQQPDLVLSSSAVRALETARAAAQAGAWSCQILVEPSLYHAPSEIALELIRQQDDEHQTLLVAGHEPTVSELVGHFVGGAEVNFPTAAMARLDLPIDRWSDARFAHATLAWLVTPKLVERFAGSLDTRPAPRTPRPKIQP